MPILEIWSTTADEALDYVVQGYGSIEKHNDPDDDTLAAEQNDEISTFPDGSYTLVGHTGNQHGDAFKVEQKPAHFQVYSGASDFKIVYDGEDITDELLVEPAMNLPPWVDLAKLKEWAKRYLGTDDGSTDDGSTDDGSTDDGSTDDGSTDDGDSGSDTGDGTDDPAWLQEVAYFRTEPQNPVTEADADVSVGEREAFIDALTNASQGDVIWVESDAAVDLSGIHQMSVGADDVTVASDRNIPQGRRGGALVVNDHPGNVIKTRRSGLRFTGLLVQGPIPETFIEEYDPDKSAAFGLFYGEGCEFDNCEFTGWPFAGLALGAKSYPVSHDVHHCDFHDNLMQGLGYGLELFNGHHVLHHNYFNRNRHDIAGFGRAENGFEAYHNVSGPEPYYHAFDMHGLSQNTGHEGLLAGGTIDVHDNLFEFTHSFTEHPQEAFKIRGIPDDHCYVRNNHFRHTEKPTPPGQSGDAYMQSRVDSFQNFTAEGNEFGTELTFDPPAEARTGPVETLNPDQPTDPFDFTISSTSRTPAMDYKFRVVGTVGEGGSLEDSDTIDTSGEDTVVSGVVGPRGSDTYRVDGVVSDFSATRIDDGSDVPEMNFAIRVNGSEVDLWRFMGWTEPEVSDQGVASIGGGEYYSRKFTENDADILVVDSPDASSLIDALDSASSGDVVYVDGGAEIYSPDKSQRFHVPAGVTLASNRGVDGSQGALIHTDAAYGWGGDGLVTVGQSARVTGIRVRGPHPDVRWRTHTGDYEMAGIRAEGTGVEVDNCEVYGWAHCVRSGNDSHIHHNYIHHANMQGLGYAIHAGSSTGGVFEYNHFEHWRHVVAGSGGGGYEARFNLIDGPCISHAFDQHSPGGTYCDIHHNTSRVMEHDAKDKLPVFACFRGTDVSNAEVYNNWVQGNTKEPRSSPSGWTDEFIVQAEASSWGDVSWSNNHLGTSEPGSSDVGCPR